MTRSVLKILFRFAMPYRAALPVLVALGLTASLAEGLGIGLLIPVLSSMVGADGVGSAGPFARAMEAVGHSVPDESRFFLLSLLIAALVAFKTLVLVVNVRMASRINGNVTRDLRVGLAVGPACIGCTRCAQRCPAVAIVARPHERHEIDAAACTRCDLCRQLCPVGAVVVETRAGA